jgi:hypothetical protein
MPDASRQFALSVAAFEPRILPGSLARVSEMPCAVPETGFMLALVAARRHGFPADLRVLPRMGAGGEKGPRRLADGLHGW